LRESQLAEAIQHLREDIQAAHGDGDPDLRDLIRCGVRVQDPMRFLDSIGNRLQREELSVTEIASMLALLLVFSAADQASSLNALAEAALSARPISTTQ
jgi:hypothetical protein